ncbi:MAG: hypothetical protein ABFE13_22540 [Phycisphaerales bacterium]
MRGETVKSDTADGLKYQILYMVYQRNASAPFGSTSIGSYDHIQYVMNLDGTHKRKLSTQEKTYTACDWSPDGRRVAFSTGGEICVMNADGSGTRILTDNTTPDTMPVWSPDGRHIAYIAGDNINDVRGPGGLVGVYRTNESKSQIRVMRDDGSENRPLAQPTVAELFTLAFSPRGDWIIYNTHLRTASVQNRILSVRIIDGTRITLSTSLFFAVSKCGKIAFCRSNLGERGTYIVEADGSGMKRISETTISRGQLRFSPDGSKLAYLVNTDQSKYCVLAIVDMESTNVRLVTPCDAECGDFDWITDNKFVVNLSSRDTTSYRGIYTVGDDGHDLTQISDEGYGASIVRVPT